VTSATHVRPDAQGARPRHLSHVVFIAAAAAMGGFLFGYDSSVINGAVVAIQDRYAVGAELLAQAIAAALIGCAVGAATAGRLADRVGRIRVTQTAAALFTVFAVLSIPFILKWVPETKGKALEEMG
jgi:SP family sugar:H+ symporter-like MFS transporter